MSKLMGGLYWTISQIMIFWHGLWHKILPDGRLLGTNWSWILAIVFLVVTIRIVLFPVFVKQIKSQRAMQALQPKMKELQEKYKGDRETMQQELMKLYKEEKVNPLMGCLPMFLQIPVFISLFHVLRWIDGTKNQMLYGWTRSLYDSAAEARLFGAPMPAKFRSTTDELSQLNASSTNVKIVAGVLVVMMMATTFLSSRQMIKKTGRSDDPQQRMMQNLMMYGIPLSLLVSGWMFPLGVIIYWVTNNLISLGQQAWVLHKYPPPAISKSAAGSGSATKDAKSSKNGARLIGGKTSAVGGKTGGVGGKTGGVGGKANGKVTKTDGKGTGSPVVPAKALAPKPGAKPVNPKKGGASKRQLG